MSDSVKEGGGENERDCQRESERDCVWERELTVEKWDGVQGECVLALAVAGG